MPRSVICVDASIVMRLVVDPAATAVHQLWQHWDVEQAELAAPTLLYYEVANALYQYRKRELLSLEAVRLALEAALALPIRLHGSVDLHQHALRLAARFTLPATYDAYYLALAEQLTAEFWTVDRRLARAVENDLPWVHVTSS